MTFDPNVPNASQSPGLFPPQNNTNFKRLKKIINSDHVFNDSAQSTDGVHKQSTMVERDMPSSLPDGTNGMAYVWIDSQSRPQYRFYNGTTDTQLTPPDELYPIRVVGTQNVSAGGNAVVLANPGYTYAGTAWATVDGTNTGRFYNILRMGANRANQLYASSTSANNPVLGFSGNNLVIANISGAAQTLTWSIIINRIS